jgi:hypothetical protein
VLLGGYAAILHSEVTKYVLDDRTLSVSRTVLEGDGRPAPRRAKRSTCANVSDGGDSSCRARSSKVVRSLPSSRFFAKNSASSSSPSMRMSTSLDIFCSFLASDWDTARKPLDPNSPNSAVVGPDERIQGSTGVHATSRMDLSAVLGHRGEHPDEGHRPRSGIQER